MKFQKIEGFKPPKRRTPMSPVGGYRFSNRYRMQSKCIREFSYNALTHYLKNIKQWPNTATSDGVCKQEWIRIFTAEIEFRTHHNME
jgi:hypothetical protein